jgi:hypothetical protein
VGDPRTASLPSLNHYRLKPNDSTKHEFYTAKNSAAPTASLVCVIGFLEARDRLSAEFAETGKRFEMKRKVRKVGARRIPAAARINRLEESLGWPLRRQHLVILLLGSSAGESWFGSRTESNRVCQTYQAAGDRCLIGGAITRK